MHSSTDSSTDSTQQPHYNVAFHKGNGKLDGQFLGIPEPMLVTILRELPKNWIAIVYNHHTNEPVSTYSH